MPHFFIYLPYRCVSWLSSSQHQCRMLLALSDALTDVSVAPLCWLPVGLVAFSAQSWLSAIPGRAVCHYLSFSRREILYHSLTKMEEVAALPLSPLPSWHPLFIWSITGVITVALQLWMSAWFESYFHFFVPQRGSPSMFFCCCCCWKFSSCRLN